MINKLPIKEPLVTFSEFKVYYLLIGLVLLFTYLFNNSFIKNNKFNLIFILKRLTFVLFIAYFIYLSINDVISLINVIKMDKDSLTYHELTKVKDSFIVILVNNGFELLIRGHEFVNGIKISSHSLSVFSCSCYQGIFQSSAGYLTIDDSLKISFHILTHISQKEIDKLEKSKKETNE